MGDWYTTREALKAATGVVGDGVNDVLDDAIEASSRSVDKDTGTRFIPRVATLTFDLAHPPVVGRILHLPAHLLSVSALTDSDGARTLVAGTDYRLMPNTVGPPYDWVEILRSSGKAWTAANPGGISLAGLWAHSSDTKTVGQVNVDPGSTGLTLELKRGDLAGVGHTLLVGTEQIFISDRDDVDLGVNLSGALAASVTGKALVLSGAPANPVRTGEVLRIGGEAMLVEAVNSTTSFIVARAHDGTTLATHADAVDVFVRRSYTVTRGVNGTTAAAHAISAEAVAYAPPAPIARLTLAIATMEFHQAKSGYARSFSRGETDTEVTGAYLERMRRRTVTSYKRRAMESF